MQSLVIGHQSIWIGFLAAMLAQAATPNVLNNIEPIIVPKPMSDSAINVEIVFVKNSGIVVAVAIKVAAATSCKV